MKKVYLLLECSGEYEDYMEYPLKVYTSFEKATVAKAEYEAKNAAAQEQAKLCMRCPLSLNIYDNEEKFLKDRKKCNCDYAMAVSFDETEGAICPFELWYDSNYYKIVPIEEEE